MQRVKRYPQTQAVIEETNRLIANIKDLKREIRVGNIEAVVKLAHKIDRTVKRHEGNFIESVYEIGFEAYGSGSIPAGERPITTRALQTIIGRGNRQQNANKKKK